MATTPLSNPSSNLSSTSSEEEEEEEEEEEKDFEEDEKDRIKDGEDNPVTGKRKRRKRSKAKPPGHRRNIKTKYDTIEDLNPEALSAQNEELQRIRRLELQQSIIEPTTSTDNKSRDESRDQETPVSSKSAESVKQKSPAAIITVDLTEDDDEDEEMIIVDDKSSTKPVTKEGTSRVLKKYDVVGPGRKDGRVLININHPPNENDVFLVSQMAAVIQNHQIGGIRFLYDNIIESLERFKTSPGFGCILAHAMGLGKTLQVIGFIEVFLRATSAKRVLCIVPVNTLQNWSAEFDKWLPLSGGIREDGVEVSPRNFTLFMLSENVKSMESRYEVITSWYKMGGVLLLGYEMYRLLALSVPSIGGNKMAVKRKKKQKSVGQFDVCTIDLEETEKEMDFLIGIQEALCSPGPDMIVCDEGHRIKNDTTNLSQALKRVKTRRRIVMTGYPLQNNLLEYWCMVDFVRPMYLGTKQEFLDLFQRPITNGQCIDSTAGDVRLMRYRSHVLHELLEGFVLRRGHEILHSFLPPKFEHVLLLRFSNVQRALYNLNVTFEGTGYASCTIGPLKAFAVCSKIWNHPDIYYEQSMNSQRNQQISQLFDEIGLPSAETSCNLEWPHDLLPNYQPGVLENSPKMAVIVTLVELSVAFGDKILIFSQSLPTLSYIEKVLSSRTMPLPLSATITGSYQKTNQYWTKGKNYYRLDGSTNSAERDRLIGQFNSPNNDSCWAFLLSTRAGCLGVNLIGANRVIVVDVSWNPCYDSQAVCRVYRYGQLKPSYIYRLVSDNTMEKRMYDRQVSKQGMSDRIVDELNPERHFTANDILSLLSPMNEEEVGPTDLTSRANEFLYDPVMMKLLNDHSHWLTKLPFKHESLLLDSDDERLTDVEKYVAMKGFQQQLLAMRKTVAMPTNPHPQPAVPMTTNYPQATIPQVQQPVATNQPCQEKVIDVICLDSDSDTEETNTVNLSTKNSTLDTQNSSLNVQNPSQQTMITQVPSLTDNQAGPAPIVDGATLPVGHTPSEAAVAQALAGFIQFQRQLCKRLDTPSNLGESATIINTLASTLQHIQNPPQASTSSNNKQQIEPSSSDSNGVTTSSVSTSVPQLAVKPNQTHTDDHDNLTATSLLMPSTSFIPSSSSSSSSTSSQQLYSLVNSLQHHGVARKAAIVPPISHRPPPASEPQNAPIDSLQDRNNS